MVSKDHILNEIKREAAASNGVAPGFRKFRRETGIRDHEWLRYWPRWSDAVREAGLTPNEKISGYSDERLLEQFIRLARDLGKFPTIAERNLRRRRDTAFPSEKTFRRFGTKDEFTEKVRDYCRSRTGYDDILKLCATRPAAIEQAAFPPEKQAIEFGFVYLLQSGRHYKIGKTNAAGRRERELAIQLPDKAKTIHVIRTDDPHGIEAYWHRRFEAKRKNGEWFDLGATEISAFKRRKFM